MPVRKPLRSRKTTRGRKSIGLVASLRSNRWTGTSGIPVAAAFAALVALLAFAYSASPPAAAGVRTASMAGLEATPSAMTAARPAGDIALSAEPVASRADAEPMVGPEPTVVTLTGCLARHDQAFRLNDATGVNAPKSRSWKSGFLTKRSAAITVLPAASTLALANHVGRRVTVTGTLVDRELRVRTLRRVSDSCDDRVRV